MLYKPWPHWTRWCTSHNHQIQYLSNSKTTSNSCCINLDHTGPDGAQVTIIRYNIYQTLRLLVTRVVLTLASLDQKVYNSTWVQMYLRQSTNCGHYFNVSYWRRDRHFTWSSEPREGSAACSTKRLPSFSVILRPWVIVQTRESNPPPPALQSCALPTELIPPVQCETQNNEIQNMYTEILLHSTDECQPLDALKSSTTV